MTNSSESNVLPTVPGTLRIPLGRLLEGLHVLQSSAAISIPRVEFHDSRKVNEDFVLNCPKNGLYGVFDKLGGVYDFTHGQQASQAVAEELQATIAVARERGVQINPEFLQKMMIEISASMAGVYNGAKVTTATILVEETVDSGESAPRNVFICNSGDSRAYLFRDGALSHLTLDQARGGIMEHPLAESDIVFDDGTSVRQMCELQQLVAEVSYANELVDRLNQTEDWDNITKEEINNARDTRIMFKNRNFVLNCVGSSKYPVAPSITRLQVLPGDLIVLTSDGIHDNLKHSEIAGIITTSLAMNPYYLASKFIGKAQQVSVETDDNHRAKPDDMSVVIKRY